MLNDKKVVNELDNSGIGSDFFASKSVKSIVFVILVLFSILTGIALWQDGILGIFAVPLKSAGGLQIFVDLVISLSIVLVWIWYDTKKTNRSFLPWLILTLSIGSFGPLLYLLFRKSNQTEK